MQDIVIITIEVIMLVVLGVARILCKVSAPAWVMLVRLLLKTLHCIKLLRCLQHLRHSMAFLLPLADLPLREFGITDIEVPILQRTNTKWSRFLPPCLVVITSYDYLNPMNKQFYSVCHELMQQ